MPRVDAKDNQVKAHASQSSMKSVKYIVTHPGGAHKDDFLACCLLVHQHKVPIRRKEPEDEELADPEVIVVDVGHEHDPEKGNFDHHQFPFDHPPTCALSLVLQDMELYEDARNFCDWLEPAEWLDTRGPNDTAKWMGVPREAITQLVSPIDVTLLRRFASCSELDESSPIWQIMQMVGEDLVVYLRDLRKRLEYIDEHAEFWEIKSQSGEKFEVLYMPRTDPMPKEASGGLGRYIDEQDKADSVIAMVYPDRRGEGYGLSRYNDDKRMDFSALQENCEDVHFAHKRGFVCKTSASTKERLVELLQQALQI